MARRGLRVCLCVDGRREIREWDGRASELNERADLKHERTNEGRQSQSEAKCEKSLGVGRDVFSLLLAQQLVISVLRGWVPNNNCHKR